MNVKRLGWMVLASWGALVTGNLWAEPSQPPPVVGRVAHVDGELLRYVPAEEDWVATVADSPVGPKDVFYSDTAGRAELSFPNRTLARLGPATQVEVVGMDQDLTDLFVASGQFRVYNRSSDTYLRVSTQFGYVVAPPGTVADLYVGEESVEVVSLAGTVQFMHTTDGYEAKYDVVAGGSSLVADRDAVSRGEGTVDGDWDRWNGERDRLWAQRQRVRSEYLPEPLQEDASVLEENGRWERVYYDGQYRTLWRPTTVAPDWMPYSVGRWTTWYDEQVWVPYEPFGYVTHHYGNWVVVGGAWYWMPPVVTVSVGVPRPWVYWYPGRVAWVHTDVYVGWVPLAPWEPYYAVHAWGPGVTVWAGGVMPAIAIGTLAFVDYAVCVHHDHFWAVGHHHGYYGIRVTNINKTVIINNFRAAPVVHKTVFKNVTFAKNQYRFVDREVSLKPHKMVVNRIKERQQRLQPVKVAALRERVNKAPKGQLAVGKRVAEPRVMNKLVRANEVDNPAPKFQEVKPKGKAEKPKLKAVGPAKAIPGSVEEPKGKAATGRPPGWEKGRKEGWEGTVPPGQEKPKPRTAGKPGVGSRPERPEGVAQPKGVEKPKGPKPPKKPEGVEPGRPKRKAPEALERPRRPGAPEAVERPKRPARPEAVERPKRPGSPETMERPKRPVTPEGAEHPHRPARPEGVEPKRKSPKPQGEEGLTQPRSGRMPQEGSTGLGRMERLPRAERPVGQERKLERPAAEGLGLREVQRQGVQPRAGEMGQRPIRGPQQQGEAHKGKGKQRGEKDKDKD